MTSPLITTALLSLSTAAFALNSGEHAIGSITPVGDSDSYTFTANIGENVRIGLGETDGISFAPRLSVQAPGGSTVGTNTSSSSAALAFQAPETGTYTIFVSESGDDATGDYDLNLAILPGAFDTSGDNGSLTNGLEQAGSLPLGDHDLWDFSAQRGDAIRLGVGETDGIGFSPLVELFDPNGQRVAFDSGADSASLGVIANLDGTYIAVVSESGKDAAGDYQVSLAITPLPFNSSDDNGSLTNGLEQTGNIDLGDFDLWSFSVEHGDAIRLGMGETGGSGFSPLIELFDPNGRRLASNTGPDSAAIATNAALTGNYVAIVSDSGQDSVGSYELSLAVVPQSFDTSGDNGTLTNGLEQTGAIDLGDFDLWSFDVSQGDSIYLGMGETGGSGFSPQIELFDSNGQSIALNSGVESAVVTHANAIAGTYTALISDSGKDATGSYELSLAVVPTAFNVSNDNGSLVNGLEQAGYNDLGDYDIWTFEAERGDTIRLGMGETSGSGYSPFLRLVDPNGATITTSTGPESAYIQTVAATDGTYTAVASDSGKNDTGGYSLSLAVLPYAFDTSGDNGILTNGVAINGSTDLGDFDLWVLSANAGDTLNLSLDELTGSGYSPLLELVSPDGSIVASNSDPDTAVINYFVPVSGVYYLVVSDSGKDGIGTYELDTSGFTGPTPSFSMITPDLELQPSLQGQLELTWQADLGWTLETSEGDLSSWQTLEGGTIDGTRQSLDVEPNGKAFFRLNDNP